MSAAVHFLYWSWVQPGFSPGDVGKSVMAAAGQEGAQRGPCSRSASFCVSCVSRTVETAQRGAHCAYTYHVPLGSDSRVAYTLQSDFSRNCVFLAACILQPRTTSNAGCHPRCSLYGIAGAFNLGL